MSKIISKTNVYVYEQRVFSQLDVLLGEQLMDEYDETKTDSVRWTKPPLPEHSGWRFFFFLASTIPALPLKVRGTQICPGFRGFHDTDKQELRLLYVVMTERRSSLWWRWGIRRGGGEGAESAAQI